MNLSFSIILAATLFGLAGCDQQTTKSEPNPTDVASNTPPVAAAAPIDSSKLKGRWERPDGGYVLEIRDIAADGKADAGYFNPTPIKVESAQVSSEGGAMKLYVVLRDQNYPGCTYTLTFDAQADQLSGKYFQATMQQTYDIAFGRMK